MGQILQKIRIELAKSPDERLGTVTKTCTEEFDRLMEISPNIDEKIIRDFYKTFQKLKTDNKGNPILNNKQMLFQNLKKPEIAHLKPLLTAFINNLIQLTNYIENKLNTVIKEKKIFGK